MKPKIILGQPLSPAVMAELTNAFEVLSPDASDLQDVEGLIGLTPSPALLDRLPRLRAIATISAGYDAFDVPDLTRRGILLMNCPGALTETTADLAFTLILAAARRVTELSEWMKAGGWQSGFSDSQFGVDVHGKTLGIVGLGRIGAAIARRGALGFGMRVLYSGPSAKPAAEAEFGAQRRDLPDLLRESDFVCLAMPLRPETDRLIGANELAQMKPTGILVNIARGRVMDETALIESLQNGTLRAAGLDVYEREPLPMDSPLLQLPNVVLLPHIGSATRQTRDAMALESVQNLIAFVVEGRVQNGVNV